MALIKCTECGQEISTEAFTCPHCGKPNVPISIKQARIRKKTWKTTIESIILVSILIGGAYYLKYLESSYSGAGTFIGNLNQNLYSGKYKQVLDDVISPIKNTVLSAADTSKKISLQEVNNLGYTFYVGIVDNPNTPTIGDELKIKITKIVSDAHFPKNLLKNIPIVILNSLAVTSGQYIATPAGDIPLIQLGPSFLSEGGYFVVNPGGKSVIYLNKNIFESDQLGKAFLSAITNEANKGKSNNEVMNAITVEANNGQLIDKGQLTDVLTHELGHAIDTTLTEQDWVKYYQLRGIPAGTPRQGQAWNIAPREDFAEVYKNTFTGLNVRTNYGLLVPVLMEMKCMSVYFDLQRSYSSKSSTSNPWGLATGVSQSNMKEIESKVTADPRMQSCRKDVASHPEKYPDEFQFGAPYKSAVDQQTKNFVNEIVNRVN